MTDGSDPHPGRQDDAADLATDTRPQETEAGAQRRESVMPLIWAGLGALAVLVFIAALWLHAGGGARPSAGAAPIPATAPKAP